MSKSPEIQVIPVRFEVNKIMYRNSDNGYSVFKAKFTHYPSNDIPTSDIVLIGNFYSIQEEDEFEGEGHWTENATFGHQFVVKWNKLYNPVSKKGLKKFLQRFVKGIGSKTADAIVDYYKEETLQKIRESWKNLVKIDGIGEKRAKLIHEKIAEHDKFEKISMFVLQFGAGYKACLRIYDSFGDKAIERIKENPYSLCNVPKIGFLTADKFGKNLGHPVTNPLRTQAGILYFIETSMKKYGHLYLERNTFVKDVLDFLTNSGEYKNDTSGKPLKKQDIEAAIDELTKNFKLVVENNAQNKQCIYLSRYNKIENDIVKRLKTLVEESRVGIVSESKVAEFITDYEANNALQFAENQKNAIYMAMKEGISILTGGPGTGKTQTINSIIKCIQYFNPAATVLLAAPTGKAAKRMTELTKMESKTIHRLINLSSTIEDEDLTELIYADYLIVDESSMIDAYVFYKLICSIDENTRLLLVGDSDQLPSVGPGLILRDMISSEKIPTTRLNEIFRQAKESQIVMNSHRFITGHKSTGKNALTFDKDKNDFYFIRRSAKLEIQEGILECIQNLINNKDRKLTDIQVLSPMKKGEIGVHDLNKQIQKRFNPPHFSKSEIKVNETNVFRVGDKVMQITNNYDLEVYNGEVGYIKSIERDGDDFAIFVDFEDKEIKYDNLSAEELTLAYAITIHKSQGSEFPVVIMPIHSAHDIMLNRNIVYTAWTRAKELVVCIGSLKTLDKAVDKTDNTVRNSKIKEKLQKQIKSS